MIIIGPSTTRGRNRKKKDNNQAIAKRKRGKKNESRTQTHTATEEVEGRKIADDDQVSPFGFYKFAGGNTS